MRVLLTFAVLLLVGCATQSTGPAPEASARPLASPAALGGARSANQIVRGALGDRELTLNVIVTVKPDSMSVVGLSAMGVRVFTIRYDGRETKVENTLPIPAQLTPERLLADIQLVYWPLSAIEKPLHDAGWQVSESVSTRRLKHGDRLVAEVHYASADPWQGRSWLVNLEHGYTLNIESKPM